MAKQSRQRTLTLDVYSEVPDMQEDAANRMDETIRSAMGRRTKKRRLPTQAIPANLYSIRLGVVGAGGVEPLTSAVSKSGKKRA